MVQGEDESVTNFKTRLKPLARTGRFKEQGYLASGDGYTHRYDKITMGFKNIKRVIDVTLLRAKDLTLVGRNEIILNSKKFH